MASGWTSRLDDRMAGALLADRHSELLSRPDRHLAVQGCCRHVLDGAAGDSLLPAARRLVLFSLNRLKVLVAFFVAVHAGQDAAGDLEQWHDEPVPVSCCRRSSPAAYCGTCARGFIGASRYSGDPRVVSAFFGQLFMLFPLFAAYPFIYFATSPRVRLPSMARIGDISFGLYLYGWPVAKICRAWLGDAAAWWSIWLLSTLLTIPIAYASWHLVEKPALSLKRIPRLPMPFLAQQA